MDTVTIMAARSKASTKRSAIHCAAASACALRSTGRASSSAEPFVLRAGRATRAFA
jgi:hypothetical protein